MTAAKQLLNFFERRLPTRKELIKAIGLAYQDMFYKMINEVRGTVKVLITPIEPSRTVF